MDKPCLDSWFHFGYVAFKGFDPNKKQKYMRRIKQKYMHRKKLKNYEMSE